jgi:4-hydroxy 2-oxovalerate aldolase
MKALTILDCTLRDGGYYNNWNFDRDTVNRYLQAMSLCNVDIVELGLRNDPLDKTKSNFQSTTEDFLLNAKDFFNLPNDEEVKSSVNKRFLQKEDSVISLVRVAVHYDDALKTKPIIVQLKALGYKVGLNLMQSNGKSEESYVTLATELYSWDQIDVLYFADSLGNMDIEDVKKINNLITAGWKGSVGFHSHNNKGFALANAITAVRSGVKWCDSTVTGMGRGAGNVTTESLLMELKNLGLHDSDLSYLQASLIDFEKLKTSHKWGSNIFYQYAADNNIHPTFVQTLIGDPRYDEHQVFQFLQNLSKKSSSSYSTNDLRDSIYGSNEEKQGSWKATGWLEGDEVLLVGGGPSVKEYKDKIIKHLKNSSIKVIFININEYLSSEIGIATVVSHEMRALLDSSKYKELKHPLILPMKSLGKKIQEDIKDLDIYDYGLNLLENSFLIKPNSTSLNWQLSAAYALAICTQAGVKKINLVGFDGYDKEDMRFNEMEEVILKYKSLESAVELFSLTPTLFNLQEDLL